MKKYLLLAALAFVSLLLFLKPDAAKAQLAQPAQAGQFYIFGIAYTGDNLAPGWKNGSLCNGVNTWNIIDPVFYAGTHSVSFAPACPFERGWLSGTTPINLTQYQFLYLYARSTNPGDRFEIGLSDQNGNTVGTMVPLESVGPPLQPDRWAVYNVPLAQFAAGATPVYGIVIQDQNGAPSKKGYFDEIVLSKTQGVQAIVSAGLGQPGTPVPTEKPVGPYDPQISPWVFIIPGLIILLAIFFE
jgi:hypothetical protein